MFVMNCLSLNIQGAGKKKKKMWVSNLCHKHKVSFLALQETKMDFIDDFTVKCFWGNFNFKFVFSPSRGNSGGILCVWDPCAFKKSRSIRTNHSIIVEGVWTSNDIKVMFVVVYAPQELPAKKLLWERLAKVIIGWSGEVIIMGDFNEVRFSHERNGSNFCNNGALAFNNFIHQSGLLDIQLGGYAYTWVDKWAKKMSKLDRFLVSSNLCEVFPNLTGLVLDRHLSDHRPILLFEEKIDYGPTPFRIFHSWFKDEGFKELVESAWAEFDGLDDNSLVYFKNKLKFLKSKIKSWNSSRLKDHNGSKENIQKAILEIDKKIDSGDANDDDLSSRIQLAKTIADLNKKEADDLGQKAKVKWAIEGDENTGYFHGIINKKRRHLAIQGVLVDGEWIQDPARVKNEFLDHFRNRFTCPDSVRPRMISDFSNILSRVQKNNLDKMVTDEEIRKAVWDCGTNKAPGPDGFTFEFFRMFWDILKMDVGSAVKHFFTKASFPAGCNSSFIALIPKIHNAKFVKDFRPISLIGSMYKIIGKILANRITEVIDSLISQEQSAFVKGRQILDGPMILNEVVAWCKKMKKKSMLFKVDFEKAYDSIRWDYLDDVMKKMGFGPRWCNWIRACLESSMSSVLVNGAPTNEFRCYRGLRQGDPLSPFLFILAMEGLHVAFCQAMQNGRFSGLEIGNLEVKLSHLFYADDAIFIGEWSDTNIQNILLILQCFQFMSGLKVNVQKSKLYGLGVDYREVERMALKLGCAPDTIPFIHLGLPVGRSMNRISAWDGILEKFHIKLNRWKANALSIGGRFTLIKSVLGSTPNYYFSIFKAPDKVLKMVENLRSNFFNGGDKENHRMSWVAWNKTLASKDWGGLGIGSLYALNRALLFKWVWRFRTQDSNIWVRIIKSIYGTNGAIDDVNLQKLSNSPWIIILKTIMKLEEKGVKLFDFLRKKLGDGHSTLFWDERWLNGVILKEAFPRIYALCINKQVSVAQQLGCVNDVSILRRLPRGGAEFQQWTDMGAAVQHVRLTSQPDRWVWSLHDEDTYMVATSREFIDEMVLPKGECKFDWISIVPIKINILGWKLSLNRLATRDNLVHRGIDIVSEECPLCNLEKESVNHIFFNCQVAKELWIVMSRWCDVLTPDLISYQSWKSWMDNLKIRSTKKEILKAISYVMWWSLWMLRNDRVFGHNKLKKGDMIHKITVQSFMWIANRCKKVRDSWGLWLGNPLICL